MTPGVLSIILAPVLLITYIVFSVQALALLKGSRLLPLCPLEMKAMRPPEEAKSKFFIYSTTAHTQKESYSTYLHVHNIFFKKNAFLSLLILLPLPPPPPSPDTESNRHLQRGVNREGGCDVYTYIPKPKPHNHQDWQQSLFPAAVCPR